MVSSSHPEGIFFGFDEVRTCLRARIGLATIPLAPFLTDGHTERYDCCQTTTADVRFVSPGAAHSFVWFLTLLPHPKPGPLHWLSQRIGSVPEKETSPSYVERFSFHLGVFFPRILF